MPWLTYLLGKARKGQDDDLMTIAHLTKAITLKDDFIEARLIACGSFDEPETVQRYDGRYRCCARPESGRRDRHAPAWKGERSQTDKDEEAEDGLQARDGNKPVQRTSIPLFRDNFISTRKN